MNKLWISSALCFMFHTAFADDPVLHSVNPKVPPAIFVSGGTYTYTYTFINNLPWTYRKPFVVKPSNYSPSEFSFNDQCTGKKLTPKQSCTFTVFLKPGFEGQKQVTISYRGYDHNVVQLELVTHAQQNSKVFIQGSVVTPLPSTMSPLDTKPYKFQFTNTGVASATGVTVKSSVPGFASDCGPILTAGSSCYISGNYTSKNTPPPITKYCRFI